MRLAFLGTPDISATCLAALAAAGHEIVAVYSQPPAPRGRGQSVRPSPTQLMAQSLGLKSRTPASMRDPETIEAFKALDLDAAIVVAYGQILPADILDAPRLGAFNLHASLLPRWRGAAPIQRSIMAGDPVTGVQVMRMTEGLDEGPILATTALPMAADETAGSLQARMATAGADLLVQTVAEIEAGRASETPQSDTGASYAKKIRPKEARIDWTRSAAEVDQHIRGLSPFPGAWFQVATERGPVRVKVLLSRVEAGAGAPGQVLDDALRVGTGTGAVGLLRLQREGKGPQDVDVFLRGFPIPAGTDLT